MKILDFKQIYERYVNLVYRISFSYLGDHHLAEDVCQDVFVKLYAHLPDLEESRIKPWLIQTASHQAIDYLRKRDLHHLSIEMQDLEAIHTLHTEDNSLDSYVFRETISTIFQELESHNPAWHRIIVERYAKDSSIEETARLCSLTSDAVRSMQYRAVCWLKNRYGQHILELLTDR